MPATVDIRPLTDPDELEAVVDLEIAVWGVSPRDAAPMNVMRPITQYGGVVLGAYDGERLVGMALGMPLRCQGQWLLWSHSTGVHPQYQSQSIGFQLKLAQRDWALLNGYTEIRWTFDPLRRGNAHFNLHVLGATTDKYHVAHYGLMSDDINRGDISDRVEARWKLKSPRVKALAECRLPKPRKDPFATGVVALGADPNLQPIISSSPASAPTLLAAVPRHLHQVDKRVWRYALRNTLQPALEQGYIAIDFIDEQDIGWYILEAPPVWYLYVLRCADSSLYTGITPDLRARVERHQSGKGATYTATRRPVELLGAWTFSGKGEALKAEHAFKAQTRATKLSRVLKREPFRGANFVSLDEP